MTRYEIFNEMLFEAYCKKAIINAVKKERYKKAARGRIEQPLSTLTDAMLYTLAAPEEETDRPEEPFQVFRFQNRSFPIYDRKLGAALSYLMPRDREIVLLYYYAGLKDKAVAPLVHLSQATVCRRRNAAIKRLRELMEAPV